MSSFEVLYERIMPLNADSCEWMQINGEPSSNIVAVGMYQLDEATQQRNGRVELFDVQINDACDGEPYVLSVLLSG